MVDSIQPTDFAAPRPLEKRTWVYVQRPCVYDVAGCTCGNEGPDWSEFKGHLWCAACAIDFKPSHSGVFDGPIGTQTAAMLGMSFDRFNLDTQQIEKFSE